MPETSNKKIYILVAILILVLAGTAVGYFLASSPATSLTSSSTSASGDTSNAPVIGTADTKTFSDSATGLLKAGGANGEGTHQLERPGGASQTVYLVSSIVDLDEFVGKKVEVGGQTIDAQHVGWLMDVGRVKIVE